jgi:hypothetical protein
MLRANAGDGLVGERKRTAAIKLEDVLIRLSEIHVDEFREYVWTAGKIQKEPSATRELFEHRPPPGKKAVLYSKDD